MGETVEKSVYILLTRSGTWFSRLIGLLTAAPYTHASLGLDGPDGPYYSFGRKYRRLALPAGLVEERACWSAPGRAAPCCLYELRVSQETYDRLRARVDEMYKSRWKYRYNLLGVVSCWFNVPVVRRRHYFCSQFVASMLIESGAVTLSKPADLFRPADFCQCAGLRAVMRGLPARSVA